MCKMYAELSITTDVKAEISDGPLKGIKIDEKC